MRAARVAVGIVVLVGITGSHANASQITAEYDLTKFNTTNGTVSSPYEVIDITGDTTAGTVKFTINVTAANIASGNAKFAEFGLNTSSLLSGLKASNFTGFTPSQFSWSGSKDLDGYGSFNEVVYGGSAKAHRTTSLTFTITGINTLVGNSNWTLTSDTGSSEILFAPNSGGHLFASDYFPGSGKTGFVDGAVFVPPVGTNVATPEPNSAILLGLGGIGVAFFRRRYARSAA
ncbi:MAG TPA: PEP-CTERM sorting domain-containing protein [Planctomycetaceae bacterium]|nr:PEP-CTERM sorting domain-containing protein [Planctomycetaceae bacterium]